MKEKRSKEKDAEFQDWWNKEGAYQYNTEFNNDHIPWDIMAVNGIGSQLDIKGNTPDPLDHKPIINAYGERMHHLNGIVKVYQKKLTREQMAFTGLKDPWVYEVVDHD